MKIRVLSSLNAMCALTCPDLTELKNVLKPVPSDPVDAILFLHPVRQAAKPDRRLTWSLIPHGDMRMERGCSPMIRQLEPADRDAFFQLRLRGLQAHPEAFG